MTPRLHLLPWNRPLLPQAVEYLAAGWKTGGPLDLAGVLVVVPTRQSGRRLREALAAHANAQGQAVYAPRVVVPETLTVLGASSAAPASRLASELAWIEVLRAVIFDEFRAVFPVDPPARDFGWASRLARQFMRVQADLAENGLHLAEVAQQAGPDFPETMRWSQLADLEHRYVRALSARGLHDAQETKIAFARDPLAPPDIARIVMIGVPDPLPLATRILAHHADRLPVEIVVGGPPGETAAALFDEWGRPRPEIWSRRAPAWTHFQSQVHLAADPAAQAGQVVALAGRYERPEDVLAIGLADPEVRAPLESDFGRAGTPVYDPEGNPRRRDGLHALLVLLADFVRGDAFATSAALLRCPDILDWLARRNGPAFSRVAVLRELDALHAEHLPPTLAAAGGQASRFPALAGVLTALNELRSVLRSGDFPANARNGLAMIFAARRVEVDSPLAESAAAWLEVADEAGRALQAFAGFTLEESWEVALEQFGETVRFEPKPAGALELNGWLELLWEDAPHLVVAGLNDGSVPDAVVGDAFLTEALRLRLGLKTNSMRFARDAYLLAALGAMRATTGRLDVLVGKSSLAGNPLRPSPLLLLCADDELPGRIEFLFRAVGTAEAAQPWSRAWLLRPRRAPSPARISVTALRDYLDCPFRFYLKHVLRMEPVDPNKAELDARDFGTMVHQALQVLGHDENLRACADETVLREALLGEFERAVRARYGAILTLPLVVQFESARQRLRKAASVQAGEGAAGWRIARVEWSFAFPLGDVTVRGKIDRIDRHEDGRVRVLDYKTSDSPQSPEDVHLGPVGAASNPPSWALVTVNNRQRAWVDLQLPLYVRAVAEEFGPAVACGYFNLPKATGGTALSLWEDYSAALQTAAGECAARAGAAVAAGEFWPPAERREDRDDGWTALFHRGAAASIEANWAEGRRR